VPTILSDTPQPTTSAPAQQAEETAAAAARLSLDHLGNELRDDVVNATLVAILQNKGVSLDRRTAPLDQE
jgi:hypothetical protein